MTVTGASTRCLEPLLNIVSWRVGAVRFFSSQPVVSFSGFRRWGGGEDEQRRTEGGGGRYRTWFNKAAYYSGKVDRELVLLNQHDSVRGWKLGPEEVGERVSRKRPFRQLQRAHHHGDKVQWVTYRRQ